MTIGRYLSPSGKILGGKGSRRTSGSSIPGETGERDLILERGLEVALRAARQAA